MRHCRSAALMLWDSWEDRSAEFTTDKIMAMDVNYDLDSRKVIRASRRGAGRQGRGETRRACDAAVK